MKDLGSSEIETSRALHTLRELRNKRIELEREKYKSDFFSFIREVLGYTDIQESPHREVIDFLLSPGNYKVVLLPRGSFKTSIFSISYPLWRLVSNYDLRILLDARTIERSKECLDAIKFHMERNEKFIELFGNWKYIPGWREHSFVHPHRSRALRDPTIKASGIDSPTTGGHYDLIICDDLQDEKNSQTEIQNQKAILHFKTLFPILEPGGKMIVVGTPWASSDVYSHILENETVEYE